MSLNWSRSWAYTVDSLMILALQEAVAGTITAEQELETSLGNIVNIYL